MPREKAFHFLSAIFRRDVNSRTAVETLDQQFFDALATALLARSLELQLRLCLRGLT